MTDRTDLRFAVVADVHGNRWALKAVLEDARRRGLDRFLDLGDCLYGPLDQRGTADLLRTLDIVTVSGNEDRVVVDPEVPDDHTPALEGARKELSSDQLNWLADLPFRHDLDCGITLIHGSPRSDTEYLLRTVDRTGLRDRSACEVEKLVEGIASDLILCGHDHLPGDLTLSDGRRVINPGSVGLQAYTDDQPFDHIIQTGSPQTRYTIIDKENEYWRAEFVAIEYDPTEAAALAEINGRPDWATWLRTGVAG